ncbi:MAG: hypothetical protein LBS69_10960 [Prevotellaceae bacterium]|jgi:hypothetical protein|nr:hypothetical protein [Prevotellaceae bacterium]
MEAKVVLDISSIVWNEQDFNADKESYYNLASEFVIFLQAFESCNHLLFIARNELLNEIRGQFPYSIPNSPELITFKRRALQFLSNNRIASYTISDNQSISSRPNICYDYFSDNLKIEVKYLLSEMHNAGNYIFCTFSSRWNATEKLKTTNSITKEHETIIHGTENPTIKDCYNKTFRKIFVHNPKHDSNKGIHYDGGEKVNPLSCYNERLADTTIPQNLLDDAISLGTKFYNYDTENHTFVCFKHTHNNIYHGYDENIENVPPQIKNILHK